LKVLPPDVQAKKKIISVKISSPNTDPTNPGEPKSKTKTAKKIPKSPTPSHKKKPPPCSPTPAATGLIPHAGHPAPVQIQQQLPVNNQSLVVFSDNSCMLFDGSVVDFKNVYNTSDCVIQQFFSDPSQDMVGLKQSLDRIYRTIYDGNTMAEKTTKITTFDIEHPAPVQVQQQLPVNHQSLVVFSDNSSMLFDGSVVDFRNVYNTSNCVIQQFYSDPSQDMVALKESLDLLHRIIYDGNTMAEKTMKKPTFDTLPPPLPVMVRLADASCVVFPQGKVYASSILDLHPWSRQNCHYQEGLDILDLQQLAQVSNTIALKQALAFGETPLMSTRVETELLGLPNSTHDAPVLNNVVPNNVVRTVRTSPPGSVTLENMLKERAERGSNKLQIRIAQPPAVLACDKQLVFFDLFNDSKKQTYWSFKASVFGEILDCNREAKGLDDDVVLNVYSYPRSDPTNSSNTMVQKVTLAGGNGSYNMPQNILGFSCHYNASQQDVERLVKSVVTCLLSDKVKDLYYNQRKTISAKSFLEDIKQDGKMWKALAASVNATQTEYVDHLDQLLTLQTSVDLAMPLFNEIERDIELWRLPEAKSFVSRLYADLGEI
jgi:hypothetical protein